MSIKEYSGYRVLLNIHKLYSEVVDSHNDFLRTSERRAERKFNKKVYNLEKYMEHHKLFFNNPNFTKEGAQKLIDSLKNEIPNLKYHDYKKLRDVVTTETLEPLQTGDIYYLPYMPDVNGYKWPTSVRILIKNRGVGKQNSLKNKKSKNIEKRKKAKKKGTRKKK